MQGATIKNNSRNFMKEIWYDVKVSLNVEETGDNLYIIIAK